MESSWIKWIREGVNIANGNIGSPPVDEQAERVLIDLDAYTDEAAPDDQTDATVSDDEAKGGEFGKLISPKAQDIKVGAH